MQTATLPVYSGHQGFSPPDTQGNLCPLSKQLVLPHWQLQLGGSVCVCACVDERERNQCIYAFCVIIKHSRGPFKTSIYIKSKVPTVTLRPCDWQVVLGNSAALIA